MRTRGAGEVTVASGVRAAVQQLRETHPGMRFVEAIDNATPVAENFDGSMAMLYEGAMLAVIVVWIFLRDWRATLVSAAALPLSVIPTFVGMAWFGFTLNTVTLLSLALVVLFSWFEQELLFLRRTPPRRSILIFRSPYFQFHRALYLQLRPPYFRCVPPLFLRLYPSHDCPYFQSTIAHGAALWHTNTPHT